ncbi:MAG: ATP-binding cassette domain-containing protein, partial [Gammaproteobacteria bacterium]|nr:ATP-binding cassette domain-containing protein [Gammaproteobacteria bacterium]
MLHVDNVCARYGKIQALEDVTIEIKQGEIVTLIGANGAGKTTLMMTICGDPKPAQGRVLFEGQDLGGLDTPAIMRKDIAIVPEGRRIFARLTVEENLHMGAFFVDKREHAPLLKEVYR